MQLAIKDIKVLIYLSVLETILTLVNAVILISYFLITYKSLFPSHIASPNEFVLLAFCVSFEVLYLLTKFCITISMFILRKLNNNVRGVFKFNISIMVLKFISEFCLYYVYLPYIIVTYNVKSVVLLGYFVLIIIITFVQLLAFKIYIRKEHYEYMVLNNIRYTAYGDI